jgi:hypothetical protein
MKKWIKSRLGSMASPRTPAPTQPQSPHNGTPVLNGDAWNVTRSTGAPSVRVRNFEEAIERIAPRPGTKLFIEGRKLNCRWYGLQPMLFSAIDLCTHLQVARVYLTQTVASAVDFLDFLVASYPFVMREVYTPPDLWFCDPVVPQVIHRFSRECALRNMVHTVLSNPSQDVIIRRLRAYFYHSVLESSGGSESEQAIIPDLRNYLLVHNNFTALDTIAEQVPIEKLRTFSGFEGVEQFDPYARGSDQRPPSTS